jgi:hypothetical protein
LKLKCYENARENVREQSSSTMVICRDAIYARTMYLKFELNLIEKDNFRFKIVYFFQTFEGYILFCTANNHQSYPVLPCFGIANNPSGGTLLNANAGI